MYIVQNIYHIGCSPSNGIELLFAHVCRLIGRGWHYLPAEFFDFENPVTFLAPEDLEHIQLWKQLSEHNKENAGKYITYLLSQQ